MQHTPVRPKYVLIMIITLAITVRTLGITTRSIWYDEAFSILFSEKGAAAMIYGTLSSSGLGAADIHPLGYYMILWGWMNLTGQSLPALRILSIIAGLIVVFLSYLIGRELFGEKTGLTSALIVALAPFQIHFAQEIRMYVFMCMWLLLATYAYIRASRENRWEWWGVFSISAALSQYTHNMAAFYLIALAVSPLFSKDWAALRAILISGLVAIILYLPWLVQLPSQIAKINNAYWLATPGPGKVFTLLLIYVINTPIPDSWLFIGVFVSLAITIIGIWQTYRALRENKSKYSNGLWLFHLAFTPPALVYIVSQWQPIYLERTFLASGAIFCIWLSWAIFTTDLPRPVSYIVVLMLITGSIMGIYQHITYQGFPFGQYQALGKSLQQNFRPGDVVLHSSKLSALPSIYFNRNLPQEYIGDPPNSSIDTLAPATQEVLGLIAKPNIKIATLGSERAWFVIFQRSIDEYTNDGQITHPHIQWLEENYNLISTETWGSLVVYLFDK